MQDNFNIILGKKIREIRRSQEISLNKLAEQMGVSYQQLQKYETGTNRISAEKLFEVAQFLGVAPAQFFPDSPMLPSPSPAENSAIAEKFARIKNVQTKQVLSEIIEKMAEI
jgi:transcriptional regulator with XRE-family HTH domain